MDIRNEKEAEDILNILIWRSQKGQTRDLCFLKHHATPLPKSLTHSTLGMGIITDEDKENEDEQPILPLQDFYHVPNFISQYDNKNAETDNKNTETDVVDEEEDMMET